jgi:hypothetical protein
MSWINALTLDRSRDRLRRVTSSWRLLVSILVGLLYFSSFAGCDDPGDSSGGGHTVDSPRDFELWLGTIATGRSMSYRRLAGYVLFSIDGDVTKAIWYPDNVETYESLGSPTPVWVLGSAVVLMQYKEGQEAFWCAVRNTLIQGSGLDVYQQVGYANAAGAVAIDQGKSVAEEFINVLMDRKVPAFATFYSEVAKPLTDALGYISTAESLAKAAQEITSQQLQDLNAQATFFKVSQLWQDEPKRAGDVLKSLFRMQELTKEESDLWRRKVTGQDVKELLIANLHNQRRILTQDGFQLLVNFHTGGNLRVNARGLSAAFLGAETSNTGLFDGLPSDAFSDAPGRYITAIRDSGKALMAFDPQHVDSCLHYLENSPIATVTSSPRSSGDLRIIEVSATASKLPLAEMVNPADPNIRFVVVQVKNLSGKPVYLRLFTTEDDYRCSEEVIAEREAAGAKGPYRLGLEYRLAEPKDAKWQLLGTRVFLGSSGWYPKESCPEDKTAEHQVYLGPGQTRSIAVPDSVFAPFRECSVRAFILSPACARSDEKAIDGESIGR